MFFTNQERTREDYTPDGPPNVPTSNETPEPLQVSDRVIRDSEAAPGTSVEPGEFVVAEGADPVLIVLAITGTLLTGAAVGIGVNHWRKNRGEKAIKHAMLKAQDQLADESEQKES